MSTRISQRLERSAALNATRRGQGRVSQNKGGSTVVATTISFTSPDTIADSGNGFGSIRVNDRIEVRGSGRNSRHWEVVTAAAGSLTVRGGTITTEAAAPLITVQRVD
jgi:hypothetical protein